MSFDSTRRTEKERIDLVFNFEAGTRLRISTVDNEIVDGFVVENPIKSNHLTYLETFNNTVMDKEENVVDTMHLMRFTSMDITKIEVIELPDPKKYPVYKLNRKTKEEIFHTILIDTREKFDKLLPMLGTYTEVGLDFFGTFVNRAGQVGWISLFVGDTFVNIDVLALVPEKKDFWKILNASLFSNPNIKKIVYNSRPIVDYLFHKFKSSFKNVFDLQVAELLVRSKSQGKNRCRYVDLSEMVERYLENIDPGEIDLLKWFELQDFSYDSPLMKRPLPDDPKLCKGVAVATKYLIRLKGYFESQIFLAFSNCVTAQMEGIALKNQGNMDHQMRQPLEVPKTVADEFFKHIVSNRAQQVVLPKPVVPEAVVPDTSRENNLNEKPKTSQEVEKVNETDVENKRPLCIKPIRLRMVKWRNSKTEGESCN